MQPADHVHLSNSERERFRDGLNDLANSVLEGVGIAFLGRKGTELTR